MDVSNDELRDHQQKIFQAIRDEARKGYTPNQKKFFSLPEVVDEGCEYVIRHLGSKAWLSACGEAIHLGMIQTEESQRGKGHASLLLQKICSMADKVDVTLSLRADPKARKIGLVQGELVAWYKRYGFEGSPERMTRHPVQSNGSSTSEPDS